MSGDLTSFRAEVSASFLPVAVERLGRDPFRGGLRTVAIDDVHMTEIAASAHSVERTPALIAESDPDYYKASLQVSGTGFFIQDGREALLRPGDLAVYDTDRPYSLLFEGDMRALVFMFPRDRLILPPEMVGQLTAHRFSGERGLGAMIIPFLQELSGRLDRVGGITGPRLTRTAIDLLTTMFASELDLDEQPADPHQLLMTTIRRYVDAHLGSPELGPAEIAAAHFISTRHLHTLFREQGTTVSTWVRERRLEACRRDLLDPMAAHLSVGGVAARWGFLDAAHFSRVFKAKFGMSPSDLRAAG